MPGALVRWAERTLEPCSYGPGRRRPGLLQFAADEIPDDRAELFGVAFRSVQDRAPRGRELGAFGRFELLDRPDQALEALGDPVRHVCEELVLEVVTIVSVSP